MALETADVCENCGRSIGKLETPCVWLEKIVCFECHRKLKEQNRPVQPTQAPQEQKAPEATDFDGTRVILALMVVAGIVVIIWLVIEWISRAEINHRFGV